MSQQPDVRALIRRLREQGFTVTPKRSRLRVSAPDGRFVIMPGPAARTSARALLNARAELRRIGAEV